MSPIQKRKSERITYTALVWGLILVLAAVVLILDDAGVPVEFGWFSPWRIILGFLLFAWLVYEVIRLKFTDLFFPIAFLFILFQKPLAETVKYGKERFVSPWIVLLAALLLTIGFKILFKPKREVTFNGHTIGIGRGEDKKVGDQTMYFDASDLANLQIREHIGTVDVYLSNKEAYTGDGKITVTENLGIVKLHLPVEWNVVTLTKENLGKVTVPDHEATGEQSITLVITQNLGEVTVVFE